MKCGRKETALYRKEMKNRRERKKPTQLQALTSCTTSVIFNYIIIKYFFSFADKVNFA